MTSFLKKPKLNAPECVNALETISEEDDCQPTILEDENEIGELYHHQNSPDNSGQTCVTPYIEKDANGVFELVQQNKQFVGLGGSGEIGESSESGGKSPGNNFIHDVQTFNAVGYLKCDSTTKLLIVSQARRSEMVKLGSSYFQNRDSHWRAFNYTSVV